LEAAAGIRAHDSNRRKRFKPKSIKDRTQEQKTASNQRPTSNFEQTTTGVAADTKSTGKGGLFWLSPFPPFDVERWKFGSSMFVRG